jgi:hypothetical protein
MLKRVFVSYSSLNAEPVRGLAADIESLGHDAWLDRELSGGQRWWDQILKEIRDCDAFVFAVSAAAADSRACLSELAYAEALGKPVLPITVEPGFAESLLPPAIAELQRVDYTTQDKVAFSALNRALSKLPPAPPSPDIPPEAPPVPASYLFDLKTAIADPGVMSAERQNELLKELRARLGHGHSRADVLALVRQFRRRDDVLVRIDRALAEFEAEVEAGEASAARTALPVPSRSRRLLECMRDPPERARRPASMRRPSPRPPNRPATLRCHLPRRPYGGCGGSSSSSLDSSAASSPSS